MLKSIFFVALVANVLLLVSSQGTIGCGGDPNARCGTDCGKHCDSNYDKGPFPCPQICIKGLCDCNPGYIYDDNANKCVLPEDCKCKKNEEYSTCINGGCFGARNCSELGKPEYCVKIDPKYCKGGCLCKEGYLRDRNGNCIPEELCCDCYDHEHYSNCTNGGCFGARHCYEKGKPVKCHKIDPKDCKKGCLCDKGYLRDKNGNCIPEHKCEPVCPKNEVYSNCINGGCIGARNCSELGKPVICVKIDPKYCKGGCLCKEGYLRDENGKCIPENQCCDCYDHEHYSNCTNGGCYGARYCYEKGKKVKCYDVCPEDCKKGCLCDKGYLRDKNGNCIPEKKCEPVCPKNEVYSNCINGGCIGARNCSELGKPVICVKIDPKYCKGGCLCKEGYLRDENGKCIPEEQCCDCYDHEHYSNCTNGGCFGARYCYEKGKPVKCHKIDPKDCKKGCLCDKGYLRDKNGNCIPEKKCEPVCPKNEVYSNCINGGCIGARNCSELGKPVICVKIDPKYCKGGCLCKEGYLRDENGKCIPEEQCCDCKEHEHYSNCTNGGCFGARHCYEKGKPVKCHKIDPKDCKKGCLCDKGYLRDKNGNCIPEKKCEPVCPKNEVYSNCINGGCIGARNCSELGKPVICVKIDPKYCKGGCLCKKGYLRDENGKCIPEELCCDCYDHEHYSNCTNGGCFGARHCYEKGKPVKCHKIDPKDCKKGCLCDKGYLRDKNGNCIPERKCEPVCPKNEVYSNCTNGGYIGARNCSELGKPVKYVKIDPKKCKAGCICKKGYLRDENGKCKPEELCCDCKEHEHYSNCTNGGCFGARHCYEKGKPVKCHKIDPKDCKKGCLCDKGYLRDKYGNCIPEKKCEPVCPKNEVYSNCTNGGYIGARNCSELGKPVKYVKIDPKKCKGGCICKKGYLRDENGKCIPQELCCDCYDHEHYSNCTNGGCFGARQCYEKGKPVKCHKIDPKDCKKGCLCDKGYLRDKYGNCIPEKKCEPVCPKNEVYSNCTNGGYIGARNCSELGKPVKYVKIDPKKCKGGCICKKGYLRDENGKCKPEELCCDCKEHEHYSNCTNGGCFGARHCYEQGKPVKCHKIDPKDCKKGCLCDKGYLRDKYGNCIPEKKCEPVCPKNEVYSNCTNGGYIGARNCSELGKPVKYVKIDPKKCKGGCICKKGYLRDENGNCIPEELCCDCKEHEHYSNCTNGGCFGARHCYEKGKPVKCHKIDPKDCKKGCLCDKGYLRDKYGNCIPEKKCEPVCPKNEVYSNCTNGGYIGARNCSELGKPVKYVKIDPKKCKGGCICKKGYLRDENGNCIPEELCCDCKEHEHYSNCTNGGCFGARHCYEKGKPVKCHKIDPKDCKKGCLCDKGYLRDKYGNCIPEKKCEHAKCTKPHEYYEPCPDRCPERTCADIGKRCGDLVIDKTACRGACRCEPGYYRNYLGECISKKDCLECTGPHEFFSCGGACDNECAKLSYQNRTNCPIINVKCNDMCYCEDGYARNKYNICIPIEDCEKCGVNEYYDLCPPSCSLQLCDKRIQYKCPATTVCKPACRCKKGHLRNKKGICVPEKECECNGDPNAEPGCGINCGRLCSNYDSREPIACILLCRSNGCDCKKGYVYDTHTRMCVLPKDCSPETRKNEVYSKCIQAECRAEYCSDRDLPVPCPFIEDSDCEAGYVCRPGYYRLENGTCVHEDECDEIYDDYCDD